MDQPRDAYTLAYIQKMRDHAYRRTSLRRVRSEEQALQFIDEVGMAYLFGEKGVEMPTLWGAICGKARPVPKHHDDDDLGRTWRWKDTLPARGEVFYGKLLRKKPTLVALDLLPGFYALSPNYGELDDYLEQYQDGLMSVEARNVYRALLEGGAMATSRLRQAAGLPGKENARRFDRALTELQTQLKIVKVGISDAHRWGYAYVYDLFLRRFPEIAQTARGISEDQAMETLLGRYMSSVIAVPRKAAQRLFGWDDWNWERVVGRLGEKRVLYTDMRIEGLRGPCIVKIIDCHHEHDLKKGIELWKSRY